MAKRGRKSKLAEGCKASVTATCRKMTDIQDKDHLEFQERQSQICAKRNRAQEAKALFPPNHVFEKSITIFYSRYQIHITKIKYIK